MFLTKVNRLICAFASKMLIPDADKNVLNLIFTRDVKPLLFTNWVVRKNYKHIQILAQVLS